MSHHDSSLPALLIHILDTSLFIFPSAHLQISWPKVHKAKAHQPEKLAHERARDLEEQGNGRSSGMKRDREEWDDRDPNEVRQQRTGGGHAKARGGKQERTVRPPRAVPNLDTDAGEPQMKVEFTILRGMVGAVIGRGGNTVQGIRNRTGATVHIHSTTPKDKETSVELNGTRKQIEDAYEELRAVMATVDEEYTETHDAFSKASLELRTLPRMIGCLIGKAGSKIKAIEEASGAKVKVERELTKGKVEQQLDGDEFQDVLIHGHIDSVCKAHELVLDALLSFDPTRAKTTRRPMASNQASVQAQSMNVVDLSAQSVVGANMVKGGVTPMIPQQQQQSPLIIQAPAGGLAPVPTILVLQADGTYVPAQVVSQMSNSPATASSYPTPQMAATPMALNPIQSQQPIQQNLFMPQQPQQQQQQQAQQPQQLQQQQNLLSAQQTSALQQSQQAVQQQQQKQPQPQATLQLQPGLQQQSSLLQQTPQSMTVQQYALAMGANAAQPQQQQPQLQLSQQLPNSHLAAFYQQQQQQQQQQQPQQHQVLPSSSPVGNTAFLMGLGNGGNPNLKLEPGSVKMDVGDPMSGMLANQSAGGVALGVHTGASSQAADYAAVNMGG